MASLMRNTARSFTRRLPGASVAVPVQNFRQQRRWLNVHEHVGMATMNKFGVSVPKAKVANSPEEAVSVYEELVKAGVGSEVVVKAQVLAGGRGRGSFTSGFKGGVHMCKSADDVKHIASSMIGSNLVTKQTSAEGLPCNKVFLMEKVALKKEMYMSLMMDRGVGGPLLVASPQGGMSIEDVAAETPELIFKQAIDISVGLTGEQANQMATNLGLEAGSAPHQAAADLMLNLYKMFLETDATLVEINPLAETQDGGIVVCDSKLNFDDNAEFRQKEIHESRDFTQEDSREVEAAKYDLNYIGLSGNIGCMVNGAGLAMSTMDIIKLKGGDPANFLDVGGGATEGQVQKAFEILNADPNVQVILVNIFGGIMRCDVIAMGVLNAAREIGMEKPIVIRLQGTNVNEANKLIEESGYRMVICDDLEDAASKAVAVADILSKAASANLKVSFA
eukprot:CAMPEP_0113936946 /NCGR_PEP_ID=MMETSP1339-20121228/3684_1 /TAXON_ID=94617 /ORGANISM="Fibrocapsa japonica" /LENGTH=448 /DNA_ID=CAMNT_0000939535 /DNA_START=74 /DNA_END=1420 /DNA_ORIENTATION=- /assembly_acc=CAM_ASM_000762